MVRTTMVVAGLMGAAVLAGVAGPAMAENSRSTDPAVASGEPSRRTELTLSYMADAGYAAAVKLGCDPATGPHPKKAQACATLARTGGRPDRLPPARTMCMLIYAPIRADLTGTWQGRRVRWSRTYGNRCEMNRATGVLFQF